MKSETLQAIDRLEKLVQDMKNEGIEPFFIHAALAQVMADLQQDVEAFIKGLGR